MNSYPLHLNDYIPLTRFWREVSDFFECQSFWLKSFDLFSLRILHDEFDGIGIEGEFDILVGVSRSRAVDVSPVI